MTKPPTKISIHYGCYPAPATDSFGGDFVDIVVTAGFNLFRLTNCNYKSRVVVAYAYCRVVIEQLLLMVRIVVLVDIDVVGVKLVINAAEAFV